MKKEVKNILSIAVIIIIFILISFLIWDLLGINKGLKQKELEEYQDDINLMIVAHPDDEILWGSKELIEKKYLVVCITCGKDKTREHEIEEVLKLTGDDLISLGYTDKFLGHKSKWVTQHKKIEKDIKKIINMKKWTNIVTHNEDGEYGHIHHKKIHNMVASTNADNIHYFGKYYTKKQILNKNNLDDYKLDKQTLNTKKTILRKYKSQDRVIKMFNHMIPYEDIK